MTSFEKDRQAIRDGFTFEVMLRRKNEIMELERKLCRSRNSFRAQCIAQEIERRRKEYRKLDEMI